MDPEARKLLDELRAGRPEATINGPSVAEAIVYLGDVLAVGLELAAGGGLDG